jgi:hypothetical protein
MRSQETINRACGIVSKFDFVNVRPYTQSEWIRECENCTLYIDIEDEGNDVTIMCSDGDQYIPILINPTDNQVTNLIKALCY